MKGFYIQYLESLCRRRGWVDPMYECYRDPTGYTCLVLVNGREYQTDLAYESDLLAQENAAMRAFMVCRNFSVNGGMLARNGIVQGLPAGESSSRKSGGGGANGGPGGPGGRDGGRRGSSRSHNHHNHGGGSSASHNHGGRSSRDHHDNHRSRSSGHHSSSSSVASGSD